MKTRSLRRKRLFGNLLTYCIVAAAFVILQLLNAGGMLSPSLQGQLVPICAYVTMAVALNLVVGISGELSLGHAGFMSVGAFSGVVASISLQELIPMGPLRLLVSMLIGAFFAGIAGVIVGVPVLRLRGDYLAIVTLAFGEIIKNIINILYVGVDENGLHFSTSSEAALNLSETGKAILKGPMGVTANVKLSSFTAGGPQPGEQPFRPGHHGPAGQPHRRRERGHQRHQIQADGLCHLRRAGGHGRRALRPEFLHRRRVEVQV